MISDSAIPAVTKILELIADPKAFKQRLDTLVQAQKAADKVDAERQAVVQRKTEIEAALEAGSAALHKREADLAKREAIALERETRIGKLEYWGLPRHRRIRAGTDERKREKRSEPETFAARRAR
jgi:hypothetical protein